MKLRNYDVLEPELCTHQLGDTSRSQTAGPRIVFSECLTFYPCGSNSPTLILTGTRSPNCVPEFVSKGDRKLVPLQQTLKRNAGAPRESPGLMEPRQFPLRRAQGVCYSATPVPATDLGFVPVTCPCYAQSVPVTSNPPVSGASTWFLLRRLLAAFTLRFCNHKKTILAHLRGKGNT